MILQKGSIAFDGVDGRFEFVGYVGDKVGLQRLRGAKLLDHQVEAGINVVDLLQAAAALGCDLEVAVGHLLHGLAQLGDGINEGAGDELGDGAAHHHAEQNGPYEDGDADRNAQPAPQKPACQLRQQYHHHEFRHADQEEFHPQRDPWGKLLFHSFTTL